MCNECKIGNCTNCDYIRAVYNGDDIWVGMRCSKRDIPFELQSAPIYNCRYWQPIWREVK